ncbi:hypothetical protein K402DRAFT_133790 [Aulographum hederae CBS 113979]|uniref:Uncharacterized protein n=1 Tax=Aulographum hederae CBS 113979 TaxID=1176131 RepID=A0A6G1GV68_9PEZI|nr:hypothetical protein K402DRAFT_133790 [Aulographum hederae CBS 113979]
MAVELLQCLDRKWVCCKQWWNDVCHQMDSREEEREIEVKKEMITLSWNWIGWCCGHWTCVIQVVVTYVVMAFACILEPKLENTLDSVFDRGIAYIEYLYVSSALPTMRREVQIDSCTEQLDLPSSRGEETWLVSPVTLVDASL